jgi:hypothetical protein
MASPLDGQLVRNFTVLLASAAFPRWKHGEDAIDVRSSYSWCLQWVGGVADQHGRAETFAIHPSAETAEWPVTEMQRAYAARADEGLVIGPAVIQVADSE